MKQGVIPEHIAIIMDGNGRWAKARGLPRIVGHKKGADALRVVLSTCRDMGVRYLTLYAFSAENWERPQGEVTDLMNLLRNFLLKETKALHENGIKLTIIGDKARFSEDIRMAIKEAETLMKGNDAFHLQVALSYGSRQEIIHAVKLLAEAVKNNQLTSDAIDETTFANALYTQNIPDPDLLIRTGGEQRISNFLLWQCAYTEFYFTSTLWPDFSKEHLASAIIEFGNRERRYGRTES